jgi:hypothetical protein
MAGALAWGGVPGFQMATMAQELDRHGERCYAQHAGVQRNAPGHPISKACRCVRIASRCRRWSLGSEESRLLKWQK